MTARKPAVRYQVYVDADLARRFETVLGAEGGNRSAVLARALKAWLDRRGASELETQFHQRLNRLSAHLDRIERDQRVVIESLALFVRLYLQRDAFVPDDDPETRRRGRERFEIFVAEVGRRLAQEAPSFSGAAGGEHG